LFVINNYGLLEGIRKFHSEIQIYIYILLRHFGVFISFTLICIQRIALKSSVCCSVAHTSIVMDGINFGDTLTVNMSGFRWSSGCSNRSK
jgi:hypothetical protein